MNLILILKNLKLFIKEDLLLLVHKNIIKYQIFILMINNLVLFYYLLIKIMIHYCIKPINSNEYYFNSLSNKLCTQINYFNI